MLAILNIAILFNFTALYAFDITNMAVLVQEHNVLRYDIAFSTTEPVNAYVEYYHIENTMDTIWQYTQIETNSNDFHITTLGLLPETIYYGKVKAFIDGELKESEVFAFVTDALPDDIATLQNGEIIVNESDAFSGYVLTDGVISFSTENIVPVLRILDAQGRVVWYEHFGNVDRYPSTVYGYAITPENILSVVLQTIDESNIYNMDLAGNHLTYIHDNDVDFVLHHDVLINEQNQLVVMAAKDSMVHWSTGDSTLLIGDGLVVYDPVTHEKLWQWWTFDHFDLATYGFLDAPWYDDAFGVEAVDWLHANAVYEDMDGHYLISLAASGQIIKINSQTGEVIWILGDEGDFTFDPGYNFFYQHTISVTLGGNYLLFDNLGLSFANSRILEFSLDTVTSTANIVDEFILPNDFQSAYSGSVYQISEDNYIVCSAVSGQIFQLNFEGDITWQLSTDELLYRAYYLEKLYLTPSVAFDDLPQTEYCGNAPPVMLSALPDGGFFEGPGIVENYFDPDLAGEGTHLITYNYGYLNDQISLTVLPTPEVPSVIQNGDTLFANMEGDYQWYLDGELIAGAQSEYFVPQFSGVYQINVGWGECWQISEPVDMVTDIAEPKVLPNGLISAFPNPFNDFAIVKYATLKPAKTQLEVFNINGKLLHSINLGVRNAGEYEYRLEGSLPSGLLLLKLTVGERQSYKKMILE